MKTLPPWAVLSLAINGLLFALVVYLIQEYQAQTQLTPIPPANSALVATPLENPAAEASTVLELNPRHQLTYSQWVSLLGREADAIAQNPPENLAILAGDSISLWFPVELLPPERVWLNQGISGETSAGLLRRLPLFDRTQPQTVLVMIGINDLLKGASDEEILSNQRRIIEDLLWVHPRTQIVVQSILPHQGSAATWEGRDRLLKISNQRIRQLNAQLRAIAVELNVDYIDLYPLFADEKGYLRANLTSDGLHLSREGYLVWRAALQLFFQIQADS